jgi:hypothetical protein
MDRASPDALMATVLRCSPFWDATFSLAGHFDEPQLPPGDARHLKITALQSTGPSAARESRQSAWRTCRERR